MTPPPNLIFKIKNLIKIMGRERGRVPSRPQWPLVFIIFHRRMHCLKILYNNYINFVRCLKILYNNYINFVLKINILDPDYYFFLCKISLFSYFILLQINIIFWSVLRLKGAFTQISDWAMKTLHPLFWKEFLKSGRGYHIFVLCVVLSLEADAWCICVPVDMGNSGD